MITTELKDQILKHLIDNEDDLYYHFDGAEVAPELGTTPKYLLGVVEDLEGRGFLEKMGSSGYNTTCYFTLKIFDFYNAGGYAFEEAIMGANLQKLKLEIQNAEANIGKPQFDIIMSSVMAIIGAYGLIAGKH